jgi:trimethylamine:corrinoid methyltransferase-like protein
MLIYSPALNSTEGEMPEEGNSIHFHSWLAGASMILLCAGAHEAGKQVSIFSLKIKARDKLQQGENYDCPT